MLKENTEELLEEDKQWEELRNKIKLKNLKRKNEMKKRFILELTQEQLDNLLSNKITKMIPVINYIRKSIMEGDEIDA